MKHRVTFLVGLLPLLAVVSLGAAAIISRTEFDGVEKRLRQCEAEIGLLKGRMDRIGEAAQPTVRTMEDLQEARRAQEQKAAVITYAFEPAMEHKLAEFPFWRNQVINRSAKVPAFPLEPAHGLISRLRSGQASRH